jgi:hypothetical protein
MKTNLPVIILAFVLMPGVNNALVCNWTGATDNNWSNIGNWSCGVIPWPNDSVTISTNGSIILDIPAEINILGWTSRATQEARFGVPR